MKEFDPIESLLLARVLCDTPPRLVDLLYLFGETPDNQNAIFGPAADIYHRGEAVKVAITALRGAQFGYPGAAVWEQALRNKGVRAHDIVLVPADENRANTYTEAVELVRLMLERNLRSVAVMTPAFHLPRCFLSAISAAKTMGASRLRIYAMAGDPQPWDEKVVHSQGITVGSRAEIFQGELQRIKRYHEKGDLVSLEEALEYMRNRANS